MPLDPRSWGLGFIVQPDGTVLALQFHADEDDLHTVDMGGHPWILLRARPTEQGHLTAPSLEAWLDYAPGAAAALQAVADADQVNRDAAEQPPPPDDPTTGS